MVKKVEKNSDGEALVCSLLLLRRVWERRELGTKREEGR